jgi:hypothetical protein
MRSRGLAATRPPLRHPRQGNRDPHRPRGAQLVQPPATTAAYAATARSLIAVIITLNEQVKILQGQVEADLASTRALRSTRPGPAWDPSWVPGCSANPATARTGTPPARPARTTLPPPRSPARRGRRRRKKMVMARFIHNTRLIGALMAQALSALGSSPGARAFYDAQRAAGVEHNAALRKLANRVVGILHGCLKTQTNYDESTA